MNEEEKQETVDNNSTDEENTNTLEESKEEKNEIRFGEEKVKPKIKYCKKCGAEIINDIKFCPKCGTNQNDEINSKKCPGCGAEILNDTRFCDKCGYKLKDDGPVQNNAENKPHEKKKSHALAIILSIVGGFLLLFLIIGIVVGVSIKNNMDYENLPVKVDISMSQYYGNIDYILEDFGLDFDLVTKGGNCYSGVQTGSFETEKYGILHTEYSYCKSNKSLTFRLYNLEKDQKLRKAKPGEVPIYDEYGKRVNDYSI